MDQPHSCPLCEGSDSVLFHQENNKRTQRPYYQCQQCHLVFVPSEFYLSADAEKAEYDQHENLLEDAGYARFLNRFWLPLKARLSEAKAQCILDFGCGPGPLLAKMMKQDGHDVAIYDHFYANDPTVLTLNHYDVITSTEVIEHLHHPKKVFEQWLGLLKPNGYLGVMTKLVSSQQAFQTWHYKNDLTHVCFYSEACFQWLAKQYGLTVDMVDKDVILFKKEG